MANLIDRHRDRIEGVLSCFDRLLIQGTLPSGLCFLSVPTWCPFRAQFYFNGHNWLASKLRKAHVSFEMRDNALAGISDWQKAQDVSDSLTVTEIHARMDAAVARYVPDLAPHG